MMSLPYDIFVSARPVRIGFLVGQGQAACAHLVAVVDYCSNKWGGRYNPIILTDGASLDQASWDMLKSADPDVIVSLLPLNEELVGQIKVRLSPLHLEILHGIDEANGYVRVRMVDSLSCVPSPANVAAVAWNAWEPPQLVRLNLARDLAPALRTFIEFNFGVWSDLYSAKQAATANKAAEWSIANASELASALEALSKPVSYVYPIQICCLPHNIDVTILALDCLLDSALNSGSIASLRDSSRCLFL